MYCLLSFLLFGSFVTSNAALNTGEVRLTFKSYKNPGGLGSNGHCCDGRLRLCQKNGCDHYFIICMGSVKSTNSTDASACEYMRYTSSSINNQDNNEFTDKVGDIENPMVKTFPAGTLPEYLSMKVDVWDRDTLGRHDHVDFLRTDLMLTPDNQTMDVTISSRTTLQIQISAGCSMNYYGKKCGKFCKPGGNVISCDKEGNKVCLKGWKGNTCNEKEVIPTERPEETNCPVRHWIKKSGSCYWKSEVRRTWDDARKYCIRMGSHLLKVNSAAENKFIDDWLNKTSTRSDIYQLIWFGANDKEREGNWVWSDESEMEFANWRPREPNDENGKEDCGVIYQSNIFFSNWNGKWHDLDCDNSWLFFICEISTEQNEGSGSEKGLSED